MGHNRAGVRAKKKKRRRLKDERRLSEKRAKATPAPTGEKSSPK